MTTKLPASTTPAGVTGRVEGGDGTAVLTDLSRSFGDVISTAERP